MIYYYYRFLDDSGNTLRLLESLPTNDPLTARLVFEQRRRGAVLGLYALPGWLSQAVEFFRGMLQRQIPEPLLADFLYNLGVMLKSGLPIDVAIDELRGDKANRKLVRLADDLYESVKAGSQLSACMARHPGHIPDTVLTLTMVGENSGNLDRVLMQASEHIKRMVLIKQDIRRALIYPGFIMVCVLATAYFWIDYVLPNIAAMFRQMNAHLPPLTLAVMRYTLLLRDFIATWYPLLLAGIALLFYAIVRVTAIKRLIYKTAYHLPITGLLIKTSALAFTMEYLSLLVSAGIPLVDSLAILQRALKDPHYREKFEQVRQGLMRGNGFSAELRATGLFPGYVTRLISVGEQSGTLDNQLTLLAEDSRKRLQNTIDSLSEILRPLIILLAGGFFIFIVVILLLPIYRLISQSFVF